MCNSSDGCDCPEIDTCQGCYWNETIKCCPICGNSQIEPEHNYCMICGHKLKED